MDVTRYYYDGQNVVLETDADEAPRRSFVHGSQYIDERVLLRLPNGQEYYYLPRELYSVAALTDETGAIVEAATYDTYGQVAVYDGAAQVVEESPVGNPYYFTGRRLDLLPTAHSPQPTAKQLYHYRAREYDPGNGRFMQRDPAGYGKYMSLYSYVSDRPMVWSDPLGLHGAPAGSGDEVDWGEDSPPIHVGPDINSDWSGTDSGTSIEGRPWQPTPPMSQPTLPQSVTAQPGESCGADVTDWLISELSTNPFSNAGKNLRACCEVRGWHDTWRLCKCWRGLRAFRENVKAGGLWDYKVRPGFGKGSNCPTGSCRSTVTICGGCFNKDVPGNINYAYVGTLGCINAQTLHAQAAKAAPGGVDSDDDFAAIDLGIRLAMQGFTDRSSFCAIFNASRFVLNRTGTEGCAPSAEKYDD